MIGIVQILPVFVVLILVSSALHKLIATDRLTIATKNLLKVTTPVARALVYLSASFELASAILIAGPSQMVGGLLAFQLWASYGIALSRAKTGGDGNIDCGCSFGVSHQDIDNYSIARAVGLAITALIVSALSKSESQLTVYSVLAGSAFFALFVSASEVAVLPRSALRRS